MGNFPVPPTFTARRRATKVVIWKGLGSFRADLSFEGSWCGRELSHNRGKSTTYAKVRAQTAH
jgi:hypothetical protein